MTNEMIISTEREELYMENIKELIKDFCDDEGLNYRDDYSGRGMYGRSCVAVDCDNPLETLSGIFAYLVDSDDDIEGCDVQFSLGEPKQDSMGMGSILYFPKLSTKDKE